MPTIHHHRVQPEGLTVPMDAYNVQTAFDCGDTIVTYWLPDPPDEPPAEPDITKAEAEEVDEEATFQMRNRPIGDGEWDAWREVTLPDASPYRSILEMPWYRTLSVDDGAHHFQYRMKPR